MKLLKLRPAKVALFSFYLVLYILVLIYLLLLNTQGGFRIELVFLAAFIAISLGIPVWLSVTYLFSAFSQTIYLDEVNMQLVVRKKGSELCFSAKDVVYSYHVRVGELPTSKYRFPSYKHLMFVLKERKRICITNVVCEPEIIISFLKITPTDIETNIPFIDWSLGSSLLTTQEFEAKVREFEQNYREHTNSMLAEIISNKGYAGYAREAASRILKKRKEARQ